MTKIKNFILLILIVFICIITSFFYSNPMFLFFAGALLFSIIISIIITMISAKNLKITLKSAKRTTDINYVNDVIANFEYSGILCSTNAKLYFEITNSLYEEKCLFTYSLSLLGIFRPLDVIIPIRSSHCGKISVKLTKIAVSDFFNIIPFYKKCSNVCTFSVMPSLKAININISELHSKSTGEETETETAAFSGDIITGVVPAGAESNMRNIHWKMTARKNEIMLKEFSESLSDKLVIFPVICSDPEINDEIFSVLRSVSLNILQSNISFFISYSKKGSEEPLEIKINDEQTLGSAVISIYNNIDAVKFSPPSDHEDVILIQSDKEKGEVSYEIFSF